LLGQFFGSILKFTLCLLCLFPQRIVLAYVSIAALRLTMDVFR
jgi:hypothetical protein